VRNFKDSMLVDSDRMLMPIIFLMVGWTSQNFLDNKLGMFIDKGSGLMPDLLGGGGHERVGSCSHKKNLLASTDSALLKTVWCSACYLLFGSGDYS